MRRRLATVVLALLLPAVMPCGWALGQEGAEEVPDWVVYPEE